MPLITARRHIQRAFKLRVGACEIKDQGVAFDNQCQHETARPATNGVLIHKVGERIAAIGQIADNPPRLGLCIIEQIAHAFAEYVDAEALDHLQHFALAGVAGGDLSFEITPILVRRSDIGEEDIQHLLVQLTRLHNLSGRNADALLIDLRQGAGEAGGNSPANIRVVNMPNGKRDDFPFIEDRLPDVHIWRMGADEPGIGVIRHADIAGLIVLNHLDRAAIVQVHEPSGAKLCRCRKGLAIGRYEAGREILRFLHEGRVRGAIQCERHAFSSGACVVFQNFQRNFIDCHNSALRLDQ